MKFNVKIALENRKVNNQLVEKNVPIIVNINFGGARIQYYSGYRINRKHFETNQENQKIPEVTGNGKEGNKTVKKASINKRLKGIDDKVRLYFEENPKTANKEELKRILDDYCGKSKKNNDSKDFTFFGLFKSYIENKIAKKV